ncbi:hypothetical protein FQN54_008712 [Arachnomyces sp. PD_36]|nr:hypothetical protein FQN54_008712 [Arachnomyces sp. PD_36]
MKVTGAILSLMPFLAAAAPTYAPTTAPTPTSSVTPTSTPTPSPTSSPAPVPTVFIAKASAPDNDEVHMQKIQAAGQKFWIGGEPATYCPTSVGDLCPPGNETVIIGTSSLDALVPGGQMMYVEKSGSVGFTQAHSVSIPEGADIGGFTYAPGVYHDYYNYIGFGADGFMACPSDDSDFLQVFANFENATVPTGDVEDCIPFAAFAYHYDGPTPAWQYI